MQILENIVVKTFLLNKIYIYICYNFSSFIQEYWELIIGDFYQNGLLQFKHINSEQNKTSVSECVLCNTWHKNGPVQICALTECKKYAGQINCKIFVNMETKTRQKIKHIFSQH